MKELSKSRIETDSIKRQMLQQEIAFNIQQTDALTRYEGHVFETGWRGWGAVTICDFPYSLLQEFIAIGGRSEYVVAVTR